MLSHSSGIAKNLMLDLLDLAQLQNNTFRVNEEKFSLYELVRDAFNVVSHIASVKNVTLVPPSLLQESFSEVFSNVYSDRHRLQ